MEIVIKNGHVVDPFNEVDEKKEVLVKNGKIVDELSDASSAREIDASGKLVVPGGVDAHSHIAGKPNTGRKLRPEDGRRGVSSAKRHKASEKALLKLGAIEKKDLEEIEGYVEKSGGKIPETGFCQPNTYGTGYRYARMGYTTVVEASVPPIKALHTHEELNETPIVDKAALPEIGSNWVFMRYIGKGEFKKAAAFAAWILWATKGYGLKVVNPCGVAQWSQDGGNVRKLDQVVEPFGITSREMIEGCLKINEELGLPHCIHLHANNLGVPGNVETTVESMDIASGMESKLDRGTLHTTHVQFNSYGGDSWKTLSSEGLKTAEYVNNHGNLTIDPAVVTFKDTCTMTGDAPFEYNLQKMTKGKYVGADTGLEGGGGVVPFNYRPNNPVATIQWAAGLEAILGVEDPWQVWLTTDHPNAGPFTDYPLVMSWLASRQARNKVAENLHPIINKGSTVQSMEREYTLEELITVSRSAPAKSFSFKDKGHLGKGADADIAIFDLDPDSFDPSRKPSELRKKMQISDFTIKNGEIVSMEGEILKEPLGKTSWTDARKSIDEDVWQSMITDLDEHFKNYTLQRENYHVKDRYLPTGEVKEV